jgi:hypothetical protein
MSENLIKVARYRNTPYSVNPPRGANWKPIVWSGSKGEKMDTQPVPEEVIQYLVMNSVCFKDGELIIIEDTEEAKEAVNGIVDIDEYKENAHSKEEIIKLLNGSIQKMKTVLSKIENVQEKNFVIDIAKEIKLDSNSKLKFLSEWMNIPQDILFEEENEE